MVMYLITAEREANSADPDEMPHSASTDPGLLYLHRPHCPNKYG